MDSRESKDGDSIRRRRECLGCGRRFTSYERIDEIPYMVADEVEKNVQDSLDRELATTEIGKIIMRRLKALDKVAYVRFASVYLEFADVSEFMTELKVLVGSQSRTTTAAAKKKKKK